MNRRDALVRLGGAALFSSVAWAQPRKVYRIGFLVQKTGTWLIKPFSTALREHGLIVGRNVQLELRASLEASDIDKLAKDLVAARVDAIVVVGTHMAAAAKRATLKTPIIMYLSGWPVEALQSRAV